MQRASYRKAVEWISTEFESGNGDSEEAISEYTVTALIADLFNVPVQRIARDVYRYRDKNGFAVG